MLDFNRINTSKRSELVMNIGLVAHDAKKKLMQISVLHTEEY